MPVWSMAAIWPATGKITDKKRMLEWVMDINAYGR